MPSRTTPIQHSIESSGQINQARQRNKGIYIGRQVVKLSLCADDMILYLETAIVSALNLLKLINTSAKSQDTKKNVKKSPEFLYPNICQAKRQVRNKLPFTVAT